MGEKFGDNAGDKFEIYIILFRFSYDSLVRGFRLKFFRLQVGAYKFVVTYYFSETLSSIKIIIKIIEIEIKSDNFAFIGNLRTFSRSLLSTIAYGL